MDIANLLLEVQDRLDEEEAEINALFIPSEMVIGFISSEKEATPVYIEKVALLQPDTLKKLDAFCISVRL